VTTKIFFGVWQGFSKYVYQFGGNWLLLICWVFQSTSMVRECSLYKFCSSKIIEVVLFLGYNLFGDMFHKYLKRICLALVGHVYDSSYLEDWAQEDHSLRPAWAKKLARPQLIKLGTVVQACHPRYVGGWYQEDHDSKPAWAEKFVTLNLNKKSCHMSVFPPTVKPKIEGLQSRLSGQKARPYLQNITRVKILKVWLKW
jgi:hypothetical protein